MVVLGLAAGGVLQPTFTCCQRFEDSCLTCRQDVHTGILAWGVGLAPCRPDVKMLRFESFWQTLQGVLDRDMSTTKLMVAAEFSWFRLYPLWRRRLRRLNKLPSRQRGLCQVLREERRQVQVAHFGLRLALRSHESLLQFSFVRLAGRISDCRRRPAGIG